MKEKNEGDGFISVDWAKSASCASFGNQKVISQSNH